jgi:hypothetical protein
MRVCAIRRCAPELRRCGQPQMNAQLKVTGGARIGWVNATWPFARLTASAEQLSVSGKLIGSYTFSPDQVAALEPYRSIPIVGSGVRIIHTVQSYPEKMIFWCFGSPEGLIRQIADLGFRPSASVAQMRHRDGIAFRWLFVFLVVAVWNALFLADGFVPWQQPKGPGLYTLLAIVLLFLTAVGLNVSKPFQSWALKPGRSVSEIRALAILVLVVSAILLVTFTARYVAR